MGFNRCGVSKRMVGNIINGPSVISWVAERLENTFFSEGSVALGFQRNDKLVAGVVYGDWNYRSIGASIVIDGPITSGFLAAMFHYPFIVCQVDKIIVQVSDDNIKSKTLACKLGFVEEARIKEACVNGDMVLYTLPRNTCRFIEDRYQKKISWPAIV